MSDETQKVEAEVSVEPQPVQAEVSGLPQAEDAPAVEQPDQEARERQALADADPRKEYSDAELAEPGPTPYEDVRQREADRPQNLEEEIHRLAERAKAIVGYREHPQHEEVPVLGQEHQQETGAASAEDPRDEGGVDRS